MNIDLKNQFISSWNSFFPGAELPVTVWYSDDNHEIKQLSAIGQDHCLISQFRKVRQGEALCVGKGSVSCGGGNRYCGFSQKLRPGFEYFLSYGNEKMEGERYKKSPELVNTWLENAPPFEAPARFLILKRWDQLLETDEPHAVIFFASPDLLSALFTLANYDEEGLHAVISPMGAGCTSIIQYPYFENQKEYPSAILGMFDISARPSVGANELTFAVPMKRFTRMIGNIDESFLLTESWKKLSKQPDRS